MMIFRRHSFFQDGRDSLMIENIISGPPVFALITMCGCVRAAFLGTAETTRARVRACALCANNNDRLNDGRLRAYGYLCLPNS